MRVITSSGRREKESCEDAAILVVSVDVSMKRRGMDGSNFRARSQCLRRLLSGRGGLSGELTKRQRDRSEYDGRLSGDIQLCELLSLVVRALVRSGVREKCKTNTLNDVNITPDREAQALAMTMPTS